MKMTMNYVTRGKTDIGVPWVPFSKSKLNFRTFKGIKHNPLHAFLLKTLYMYLKAVASFQLFERYANNKAGQYIIIYYSYYKQFFLATFEHCSNIYQSNDSI